VTLLLDLAYLDYTADPGHVRAALDAYGRFAEEGRVLVGAALSLSKALTLYGGRGGALVFPWCRDAGLQAALAGSCRGLFSNCARAAQSLLVRMEKTPGRLEALRLEHAHWSGVLAARARALDAALRAQGLEGAAWTGGFFTALDAPDPARVCERLKGEGVFVVPLPGGMRVGLCGLREADAPAFARALKKSINN
jgi:aspartate/tyrosine/aromatic aminotransferase